MQKNPLLVIWRTQRLTLLAILVLSVLAPPVLAQETPTKPALTVDSDKSSTKAATGEKWGDSRPPENFVQSKAPSKSDSPYNFIQMGYAGLVMLFMGGFIFWLVRRNKRDEDAPKEA